ncbi:MAG: hypothetical protein QF406_13560 [Verrucomicrobiota bacterium]|jgi:hypothetical protein|nr:hypothetical protein [Verrucomicrobiota bacterium]
MKDNPIFKLFTSLWLTVALLSLSLVIIFLGTLAQEPMGLNIAVERFFKSWFVDQVAMEAAIKKSAELFGSGVSPVTSEQILGESGLPVFPGGYLVGTLLLMNLLVAYYQRFEWSTKKAGVYVSHLGIITLLVGQIITDILQEESFVHLERGDRRNYSVSFDDNALVFMLPVAGGSNRVVSIPEKMLTVGRKITHPELNGLTLEVEKYWVNAKPMTADQMVKLDGEEQAQYQKEMVDQVFEVMNSRINGMEDHLRENPDAEQRSTLTRLKGRFFEMRSGKVELRVLADMLGLVGEMEMDLYGLKEDSERLVFNSQAVRNLLIKVKAYEDQRTMGSLFSQATKGQLEGCTLSEFENNATDFMTKIKDFPGGAGSNILRNSQKFIERIKGRAKLYYAGTDQGQLGQFFRFIQPLQPAFDQNDRNLPAALLKVTNEKGKSGKYLFTCSSDYQQTVKLDGEGSERWKAIFRPKRHYIGFDLTLVDLKSETYPGTDIDRNFQSRVIVEDGEGSRSVDIYMNNPLRQGGHVFYQSGMNEDRSGTAVQTVLQVVKNPNWITAYIGCVIVTVGLLYQFLYHLVGFARKRKKEARA